MSSALRLRSISRYLTRSISTATITATSATSRRSSLLNRNLMRSISTSIATLSPPPGTLPFAFRTVSTSNAQTSPNDKSSEKPPEEPVTLDGCDFEHWLVVMDPPPSEWSRDQIIDSYIKTLAKVVGSEDEARMKIYSVSTKHYFSFGALISRELSEKLDEIEGVQWVLPDCYLDIKNQDYGGEPFVDGKAAPYDPKYHAEWVKNNQKAKSQSERRNIADRPRNSDRRQRSQGSQNNPRPGGNMGGTPNQPGDVPSINPNNTTPNHQGSGAMPHQDTQVENTQAENTRISEMFK